MKSLCIFFILLGTTLHGYAGVGNLPEYVEFLRRQKTAKEYILSLFERYDIVVLCERDHAEMTQYELIRELIGDPRFARDCGNIFIETCAENYKSRFDSLLLAEGLPDSSVRRKAMAIQRDMSFWPLWSCSSVIPFITDVYRQNQRLDSASKIRIYPIDRTFDWHRIETAAQIDEFDSTEVRRDSAMAANTVRYLPAVFARGKKALVIENNVHAFRKEPGNYLDHLSRMIRRPVANVFIHCLASTDSWHDGTYGLIREGRWDAAFNAAGRDFGFDLAGSPFGADPFDLVTDIPNPYDYADIFTGMVYYKPVTEFVWSWGIPGVLSDGFDAELKRRYEMFGNPISLKEIRKMYKRADVETYRQYYPSYKRTIKKILRESGIRRKPE